MFQKRTTTTIDRSDFEYIKKHDLKVAHMIRAFIRDHRAWTEGEGMTQLQAKVQLDKVTQLLQTAMRFIENQGLSDEFTKKEKI